LAEKKKRFVIEKLHALTVNEKILNNYLADAIANSTSLRVLQIDHSISSTKQWKTLCCGGLLNNVSIDTLVFNGFNVTEPQALDYVGQIFKEKKIRLVNLVGVGGKNEIIEPLISYIAESVATNTIKMSNFTHYYDGASLGSSCLRNKNIKKLTISNSTLNMDQFRRLVRDINNSNVTSLNIGLTIAGGIMLDLSPILLASNTVKKLKLYNHPTTQPESNIFFTMMKNNTTIEQLKLLQFEEISNPSRFAEQLKDILISTTTLKELMFFDRSRTIAIIDGIALNRSLTALDLTVKTAKSYQMLCEMLSIHPKIERAKIRSVETPDHLTTTLNLIRNSKSITDLDISDSENVDDDMLDLICQFIAGNPILRRIKMTLNTLTLNSKEVFWKTVTCNRNLYCFEIDISCSKPFNTSVWNRIERVLELNPGITSIGKLNDIPENIQLLLDKNYKAVINSVTNTKMLIILMARHRDVFTDALPLEIWLMIFKNVRYFGVNLDFGAMLLLEMNK